MELSPENPRLVDPEIETSHAEEFVEELRWVADTLLANQYRPRVSNRAG